MKIAKLYDAICNRIRYLISGKNGITDSINHNLTRIRIDSYNSLPREKTLTFQNIISQLLIRMKIATTIIYF